jgi:hypothetical protein
VSGAAQLAVHAFEVVKAHWDRGSAVMYGRVSQQEQRSSGSSALHLAVRTAVWSR